MRAVVAIALLTLASAGCFRDPLTVERTDTTVTLVGLVRSGSDTLSVLLARVDAAEGPREEPGARLRIDTPAGSARLVERPGPACGLTDDFTCLQAPYPSPPNPGDVVRLTGWLPSGDPVLGSTVVPSPAPLTLETGAPLPDTVTLEGFASLPLSLPSGFGRRISAPAPFHGRVWAGDEVRTCEFSGRGGLVQGHPEPSSVSLTWPGGPICNPSLPVQWDSAHVEIDILAFDEAFSAYLAAAGGGSPAYLEDGRWGIEGVTGAFGAVTGRRIVVVAKP